MAVSVVIPTTLRDTVTTAVRSVRSQTITEFIQIILVVDLPTDCAAVPDELRALVDKVVVTGGVGGAAARNAGIAAATGRLVAFLDDDDEWLPTKLADQVSLIPAGAEDHYVVWCRVRQGHRADGELSRPVPDSLWEGDPGSVEDYLFRRRRAGIGRAVIYTSTLLLGTSLARRVPWTTGLRRHQDWDWLMKLARVQGVEFKVAAQAGALIWMNSSGSISASDNWRDSLAWIETWRSRMGASTFVDFVAAQSLRYALQSRSAPGVWLCLSAIAKARRLPSAGPTLIGLAGVLPRMTLSRIMLKGGRP